MFKKLIGPSRYFNLKEIKDETTLQIEIREKKLINSSARSGKKIRYIDLEFISQSWHDSNWKHRARIYIPENYNNSGKVGIIGTHMNFCPEKNYNLGVSELDLPQFSRGIIPELNLNSESEFCEGTALDLGIPIMVFATPGDNIFDMDESDLMGYGLKKLLETFDISWFPYLPIVKSYLRAITLLHSIPEVKARKAVLFGNSKRGLSVSIAMGVDPKRIAGIYCSGAHGGNMFYMILQKYLQLGPDVGGPEIEGKGPGFLPPERLLEIVNSAAGFFVLMAFDPYIWRRKIQTPYMIGIGTNDEFTGLGTPDGMIKNMNTDKAILYIDNLSHTWVSKKHLFSWKMWLAHCFYDRPIPRIKLTSKRQSSIIKISAKVITDTKIDDVKLFYSFNNNFDWREAKWSSLSMKFLGNSYRITLNLKKEMNFAYYVEVEDHHDKGGKGYVSTIINFLRRNN